MTAHVVAGLGCTGLVMARRHKARFLLVATLSEEEQHALIEAHIDFAERGVMAQLRRSGGRADKDELTSAAYEGLVYAARKFDPARGFTFKTYAFNCIQSRMTRVYQKEKRANGWIWAPTKAEVADGAKPGAMHQRASRFEFPIVQTKDGEIEMGMDSLRSGEPNPETLLLYKEVMEQNEKREAAAAQSRLTDALALARDDRDRAIVQAALDGKTQAEVAEEMGLSRQRIQQLADRMDFTFPNKWSRRKDTNAVAVEARVVSATAHSLPDARNEVRRLLLAVDVGGVIGYEQLAGAIGWDVHSARGLLTSVRKVLLEEHQIVFGPRSGVGLKRLADHEVLQVGARSVKSVGNAAKRGIKVLAAVREFNALTNEQKVMHNTMMAQFGALAHIVSDAVKQKLEARAAEPLPMTALLEAMRDSV